MSLTPDFDNIEVNLTSDPQFDFLTISLRIKSTNPTEIPTTILDMILFITEQSRMLDFKKVQGKDFTIVNSADNYAYLTIKLRTDKISLSIPQVNEIPFGISKMVEVVLEEASIRSFEKKLRPAGFVDYVTKNIARKMPVSNPYPQFTEYDPTFYSTPPPTGHIDYNTPFGKMDGRCFDHGAQGLIDAIREFSLGYTNANANLPPTSRTPLSNKDLKNHISDIFQYTNFKVNPNPDINGIHFFMTEEQIRIAVALMIQNGIHP